MYNSLWYYSLTKPELCPPDSIFAFFYLKNVVLAFFIIILLDILVILTISRFYRVSKMAAILLVPYFVWIIFATYLNFGYLILN